MNILKNQAFLVKMVNDKKLNLDGETPVVEGESNIYQGPEIAAAYSAVAKDFITHAALVIGGTAIAYQLVKGIFKR